MTLSPRDILTHGFSTVRRNGLDPAEVNAYLAEIAEELARHHDALSRSGEEIRRLSAELENSNTDPVVDSHNLGKWVGQIVSQSEAAAKGVIAEAEAEAAAVRRDAEEHAARVRAEVDAMRAHAEVEVEAFRRETLTHANQIRDEAEQTLKGMQHDAEQRIREVQAAVSSELETRTEAVQATERALLERLVATAEDVSSALRRFHDVDTADVGDIDLTESAPTEPATHLRPVDGAAKPRVDVPFSSWTGTDDAMPSGG